METNLTKGWCGECGNDKYTIYQSERGTVICECTKCKSTSEIKVEASIKIDWHGESKGLISF